MLSLWVCRELCVVSSAWQKAVPELLDNIDTYPGLSSDWVEDTSSYGEPQVSHIACCASWHTSLILLGV